MKPFLKIALCAIFCLSVFLIGIGSAQRAQAQTEPQPPQIVNVNFPCPDNSGFNLGNCPPSTNIPNYINNLYKFAVGIAGLLALGMIVGGGVYYTVSAGSSDKQREAKDMITSAVWGVVLLLGSYLILNTVNPQITTLNLDLSGAGKLTTKSTLAGEGNQSNSDCASFPSLVTYVNNYQKATMNCSFRRSTAPSELQIGSGDYYGETTKIPVNSTIWQYPYFILGQTASTTAKCLIFAYREQDSSSTKFITLNDSLRLCAPQDQSISSDSSCSSNDPLPPNTYSDQEARNEIEDINNHSKSSISISSSGSCSDRCNKTCTSLQGIPKRTISVDLKYILQNCVDESGNPCPITITGGTEIGHQTHGLGQPTLDLSFDKGLAEYLLHSYRSNISSICTAPEDSDYRINCDNYDETVRHLHVQFKL